MTRAVKPLSLLEEEIADLVGSGLRVRQVHATLEQRGRHMAVATLKNRIRAVAYKLDNPCGLPPMAIIRLYTASKPQAA